MIAILATNTRNEICQGEIKEHVQFLYLTAPRSTLLH